MSSCLYSSQFTDVVDSGFVPFLSAENFVNRIDEDYRRTRITIGRQKTVDMEIGVHVNPTDTVCRFSYWQLHRRSPCLVWEERKFTFYHAKGSFKKNTPLFAWHLNFVFWFLSSSVTPPLFFEAGGVQWIRRRESERGEIEVQRREASRPKHISRTNINCWL